MGTLRSGLFLDEATNARLRAHFAQAQTTPAILVTQRHLGPLGKTEAELVQAMVRDEINTAVIALGLPPPPNDEDGDPINYGVDFRTGEVLLWDGVP